MMPAASGAEAEVPVCDSVHFCRKSVVTCPENNGVGSAVSGGDQRGDLPVLPLPIDPKNHRWCGEPWSGHLGPSCCPAVDWTVFGSF